MVNEFLLKASCFKVRNLGLQSSYSRLSRLLILSLPILERLEYLNKEICGCDSLWFWRKWDNLRDARTTERYILRWNWFDVWGCVEEEVRELNPSPCGPPKPWPGIPFSSPVRSYCFLLSASESISYAAPCQKEHWLYKCQENCIVSNSNAKAYLNW
jgi:hypothetical protein